MKRAVTFYYDEESGELAKVDVSEAFRNESALMRADVLGDITEEIEEMYGTSIESFTDEMVEAVPGATREGVAAVLTQIGH